VGCASIRWADTLSCLALCASMTSPIKPEVHNVSRRRQRRIKPPPQVTCAKNGKDRTCISGDMIADRQTYTHETDRHTDTVITILRCPIGGGVEIQLDGALQHGASAERGVDNAVRPATAPTLSKFAPTDWRQKQTRRSRRRYRDELDTKAFQFGQKSFDSIRFGNLINLTLVY